MMDITNTLLVVIDPTTKEQHALGQATVLAKKLNMDLELLICDYDSNVVEHKEFLKLTEINNHIENYLEHHNQYLEKLAEPLREQGFTVNYKASWDYPLDEGIIRHAMRVDPFIILKDTHYHNKLTRSVFKNTDWNLIRTCKTPLLFVKPNNLWESPIVTSAVDPIHESYDPNEHDKNILQFGKFIAHEMDGKFQVYHSYYSILNLAPTAYAWGGHFGASFTEEADSKIKQSHERTVYKLADELNIEHDKVTIEDNEAVYSIPEFVFKTSTDLLVIGATSKSRLEQAFIGGTTEGVLDEVECDILILHSPGFISPVNREYPPLSK